MGCAGSSQRDASDSFKESVKLTHGSGAQELSLEGKESGNDPRDAAAFDQWSKAEWTEEHDYLVEEQEDAKLEKKLASQYPDRVGATLDEASGRAGNVEGWVKIYEGLPAVEDGFVLTAPWTRKQAVDLFRYLRRSDAAVIPRKCVYEVLIAACQLLEARHEETGSLQHIPSPPDKDHVLYVCGDTHGQLQDVLCILDTHDLPSATNAYLFNGDIADRGDHATEIFLVLLSFMLADPTCLYVNRGNHEVRDLNERLFQCGGGFAWELRTKYPHDEALIDLFQHFFMLMPIASKARGPGAISARSPARDPSPCLRTISRRWAIARSSSTVASRATPTSHSTTSRPSTAAASLPPSWRRGTTRYSLTRSGARRAPSMHRSAARAPRRRSNADVACPLAHRAQVGPARRRWHRSFEVTRRFLHPIR